jgi:hypothetical protein
MLSNNRMADKNQVFVKNMMTREIINSKFAEPAFGNYSTDFK